MTTNAPLTTLGWGVRIAAVAGTVAVLSLLAGQGKKPAPSNIPVERHATSEKRIMWPDAAAGQALHLQFRTPKITSILNIRKPLRYGEFVWDDDGVRSGPVWIRVDLATQIMSVFRGGDEIGTAVIMYGADEKPTPTGRFPVMWKRESHQSSLYDAEMPYTLRLTNDGVSIHGADVRASAATHGCVSIPTDFASLLFTQVKVGDPVIILPEKHPSA
jgi:hypothetical protein